MLMFDSSWMPRATPETALRMKQMVSTEMSTTSPMRPRFSTQPTLFRPAWICSAPIPSEAAEPNSVAKIASMSMTLPMGPSTRGPSSDRKADEMSWVRPLRKVPYAMATPTTA